MLEQLTSVMAAAGVPVPRLSWTVALFLGIGLALVTASAWGFAALASSVLEGETRRLDHAVTAWLDARASPGLDQTALAVTALGDTLVITMILLVGSALLWVTRHRYSALLLWVAGGGSILLTYALKWGFDRPRPPPLEWRAHYTVETASFPSGHALGSMVAYAVLAYLIARLEGARWLRRVTYAVAVAAIGAIGLSRIYLGVHYPSDVIAGYTVGLAWTALCALAIEAVRYRREGRLWFQSARPPTEEPPAGADAAGAADDTRATLPPAAPPPRDAAGRPRGSSSPLRSKSSS